MPIKVGVSGIHRVASSRMDSFAKSADTCISFDHVQPWVGDGLARVEDDSNLGLEREHRRLELCHYLHQKKNWNPESHSWWSKECFEVEFRMLEYLSEAVQNKSINSAPLLRFP